MASAIFGRIELTSDFTCGAGEDFRRLGGPDHYALAVTADPSGAKLACGYDYFFCVRLANLSKVVRNITVDVLRPDCAITVCWRPTRVPLFVSGDFRHWYVLDDASATEGHKNFRARLTLASGQALYLANSLPYPSAWMRNWLEQIAARHRSFTTIHNIGQTVQGEWLLMLTITDPSVDASVKDRILVTSGFHPAEADWLATTTIVEALLGAKDWAARVRRDFIVDVVTQVNPDGYDLGTNGCNARGVNMYWDFRREDIDASPEAVYLWRWVEAHPPSLYVDFHAYVHQLEKNFRPYLRPKVDYPRLARPVVCKVDAALTSLCGGRYVVGKNTSDPRTLAAQMTAAFGTITYPKFHLHLNHGVPACRQVGLDVFRAIVERAWPYRPLYPRTVGASRPRGAANQLLRWAEQGDLPLKARRGWRHLASLLGIRAGVPQAVPLPLGPGLALHWREHLWSQRVRVKPVIWIGE